jgi:hypothetical protein
VDLVVGAEASKLWPAARHLDPVRLAAGQAVQLDAARPTVGQAVHFDTADMAAGQAPQPDARVRLVRLGSGPVWTLELQYDRFRTYLPGLPGPDEQAQLAAPGTGGPLTLLKAPAAGTGAWPTPEFLAATRPQLILWPQETTYPPAAVAALEAQGALRVEPDSTVEAVTDGTRLWLRQWAGSGRR